MKIVNLILYIALSQLLFGCSKGEQSAGAVASGAAQSNSTEKKEPEKPISAAVEAPLRSYEGPLGLAMGIPLDELSGRLASAKVTESNPNIYKIQPPKPVPGFDAYYILATKTQGLCKIMAISNVDVVNDSGDELKSRVNEIAEMLEIKYGKPNKKYDFATQDVYRRNPQFFMMALKEDAVVYGFDWINNQAKATLPNDMLEINIFAAATDMSKGWAKLDYSFDNFKSCQAEIKKGKSANL